MRILSVTTIFLATLTSCSAPVSQIRHSEELSDAKAKRKLLYEANLLVQVKEPDSAARQILEIQEKYNGYLVAAGHNQLSIRVPAEKFIDVIENIEQLGKVKGKNILGRDITDEYTDLAIRLDNAEKTRSRYLSLLEKAVSVHEILSIEKELERLNLEIEVLKGRLNRFDHLEQYATVHISLEKKVQPGPLGYIAIGIYRVIKVLFVVG